MVDEGTGASPCNTSVLQACGADAAEEEEEEDRQLYEDAQKRGGGGG